MRLACIICDMLEYDQKDLGNEKRLVHDALAQGTEGRDKYEHGPRGQHLNLKDQVPPVKWRYGRRWLRHKYVRDVPVKHNAHPHI